jgi:hypothetical protein
MLAHVYIQAQVSEKPNRKNRVNLQMTYEYMFMQLSLTLTLKFALFGRWAAPAGYRWVKSGNEALQIQPSPLAWICRVHRGIEIVCVREEGAGYRISMEKSRSVA